MVVNDNAGIILTMLCNYNEENNTTNHVMDYGAISCLTHMIIDRLPPKSDFVSDYTPLVTHVL